MSADLAVLAQDPRLGGGALAQTEAFLRGALWLGRSPRLYWLGYRGLTGRRWPSTPVDGLALHPGLPGLDALNQFVAGRRVSHALRAADSVWVVAAVASHGYGAPRSGRRYGCWIGTTQDAEWRARRAGVSSSRRVARRLNAPGLRALERATLRHAAVVCATSSASRAELADASGLPEKAVRVLPIPVDVEKFAPLPEPEWRKRIARPTLVFVGRAGDPRKNISLLLQAFERLRRRLPEVRLRLVGEPPKLPVPDGVEVVGEVDSVAEQLRDAALFVLPSRQEGFGIAAAEALAAGVPVVTTPSGGPEELIRSSGAGRVLAGFDVSELSEVVAELLTDTERLVTMRDAGRSYVLREHTAETFRDRLAALLEEVDR